MLKVLLFIKIFPKTEPKNIFTGKFMKKNLNTFVSVWNKNYDYSRYYWAARLTDA